MFNFSVRILTLLLPLLLISCDDSEPVQVPGSIPDPTPPPIFDTLISNAQLIDGLGSPAVLADVYLKDGKVAHISTIGQSQAKANHIIDANHRVLAPGFIDVHSHGDPLQTPGFENFLAQGVTTITLGQDGDSPVQVEDSSQWIAEVDASAIGVNLALFVGHGSLRNEAGVGQKPEPSADELQRMQELLNSALDYSFGLSTGLEYNPGLHASELELVELARVTGIRNRIVMSHMRNEDDDQLEASLDELLSQGRVSRVHVSHLKSVYGKGTDRAEEILAVLANARDEGIEVTADVYPYNASYAGIALLFPVWSKTAEEFAVAKETRRDELEEYLRNRIQRRNGPEATLLGTEPYTGKTLADLEKELNLPFEKILIDVIGPQGAGGAYFIMDDALQSRLLEDDLITASSDGSPTGFHPRGHGTFAKYIEEYVVNREALTLADAVRKITSFSANILGLQDRGSIEIGKVADLVLFTPENVKANATYPSPLQLSSGFDIVFLKGEIAFENGASTKAGLGTLLKPNK